MQVLGLASLAGRRDGLDPAFGVDTFLAGFGRGTKKQVVSLSEALRGESGAVVHLRDRKRRSRHLAREQECCSRVR